jgi:hypothetical protein
VPSLAETRLRLRGAVVDGKIAAIAPLLVGGRDAALRLAIHARHYQASLTAAIRTKFPATAWLIGTPVLDTAAQEFVQKHPPAGPCIAEYGEQFPAFLSRHVGTARVPYLYSFAQLEWHLGQAAIAISQPAATRDAFSTLAIDTLMDASLALQGGLRYLHASWPVDELMKLYLSDTAPGKFHLAPEDVWLEVRGARGEFQFDRLEAAEFAFRKAILQGHAIGAAAERALEVKASFDVGRAFTALIDSGRVVGSAPPALEGER